MYRLEIKQEADRVFRKLSCKDRKQLEAVGKKINEILENPLHGQKFLKGSLAGFNRVHIGHFVLLYKVDSERETVVVYHFAHHDKVYEWVPPGNG